MRGGGEETHGGNQDGDGWGFDGADFLELKSGSSYTEIGRWRYSAASCRSLICHLTCAVVQSLSTYFFTCSF